MQILYRINLPAGKKNFFSPSGGTLPSRFSLFPRRLTYRRVTCGKWNAEESAEAGGGIFPASFCVCWQKRTRGQEMRMQNECAGGGRRLQKGRSSPDAGTDWPRAPA